MIIYGWGHKTIKYFYDVLLMRCGNCGEKALFLLCRQRLWFTLFFIPIIPYSSEYTLVCTGCQLTERMVGKNLSKIKKMRKRTRQLKNHDITEDEYQFYLKEADIQIQTITESNDWECPKCKHSNVNVTYTCRHCGYRII